MWKRKKFSILAATDGDLIEQKENLCFYHWCQSTYVPLTDLHDPEEMKKIFYVDECESINNPFHLLFNQAVLVEK